MVPLCVCVHLNVIIPCNAILFLQEILFVPTVSEGKKYAQKIDSETKREVSKINNGKCYGKRALCVCMRSRRAKHTSVQVRQCVYTYKFLAES